MAKFETYETRRERDYRILKKNVLQDWKDNFPELESGIVSPSRLMQLIAGRYNCTRGTINNILKREGLYINRYEFRACPVTTIQDTHRV